MNAAGTHVYRINPTRLLLMPAVWLLFMIVLLIPLAAGGRSGDAEAGVAAAALLTVILGTIFYFTVWRSRLEVNEAGITHFQFGYTVRSSWQNLERISMQPGTEGLYLAQPGTASVVLGTSTRGLQIVSRMLGLGSAVGDYDALAAGRFIALMTFTSHLHGGPLSRDLERWAAHLFVKGVAP